MNKTKIAVIGGCGRIGLPLTICLSLSDNEVIPIDINKDVLDSVNAGEYPYYECGNNGSKYLKATLADGLKFKSDVELCSSADCIIFATGKTIEDGTVISHKDIMKNHFEQIMKFAQKGTFVIIRSTIPVGTMYSLVEKMKVIYGVNNCEDLIAYCPERLAESHSFDEITHLPQLIGAFSDKAFQYAAKIFGKITSKVIRLTVEEAEYTKLLSNVWRYSEFAIPNHIYGLLEDKEVDFNRVSSAVKYKYPRANSYKNAGFTAGPCLGKDTTILKDDFTSAGISLCDFSLTVNNGLPDKVIELLSKKLSVPISQTTIGILGIAFKSNTDDIRDSLSITLRDKLKSVSSRVMWNDPLCLTGDPENASLDSIFNECDAFIIATPHKEYEKLKLPDKPYVDMWGLYTKPLEVITTSPRSILALRRPTILITGSAGFIAGYVVQELLNNGYHVIGIDNYSKYGPIQKDYDDNQHYEFYKGDAKDVELMKRLALRCDYVLACGAMIGGISYFHEFAYDLLSENERIIAATFDAAIHAFKNGFLKKIIVLSSSMVFESSDVFPTPESEVSKCAPPLSTYGFQKLACEYFAKGAWEQYKLPYTIVRPFNAVGLGERRALCDHEIMSGNVKLAMSHVVPDLMQKVLKGQNPLRILGNGKQVRHYTYGGDLARGIRVCIENDNGTITTLAEAIWKKHYGDSVPFRYECDDPFIYDVQCRVPDCSKAEELLGFEATTTLDDILDELLPWIDSQIKFGNL